MKSWGSAEYREPDGAGCHRGRDCTSEARACIKCTTQSSYSRYGAFVSAPRTGRESSTPGWANPRGAHQSQLPSGTTAYSSGVLPPERTDGPH